MSRTGSWVPQKFRSVLDAVHASRSQSTYGSFPRKSPIMSASKLGSGYWMHPGPGLQLSSTNSNTSIVANGVKNVKVQSPAPASPSFNFPYWLRWVLGSLLSLLLPFWIHEWEKLQKIEGEVEVVVGEVQKVATVAEKVSKEVANMLPEKGKLKKAALEIEHVSKVVAHDAQLAQEFIHKVDELKNDLDDLESFGEPIIDEIVKKESERK